jgi:NCAIR mutase (PurE)-related protein
MEIINPDTGREKRCGIPEVVFAAGKTLKDLEEITDRFLRDCGRVIITKVDDEKAEGLIEGVSGKKVRIIHNKKGRVLVFKKKNMKVNVIGGVGLLTAGTSDIPVAEEARAVAEELGCNVAYEYDVGIAGIHRVYPALEKLKESRVFIVIAGMEGALPSIVAGLVLAPVIAVPTSVGYGTAEHGKTALFTMLNSCTPLAAMNIDNGYGAAVLAYKILITGRHHV